MAKGSQKAVLVISSGTPGQLHAWSDAPQSTPPPASALQPPRGNRTPAYEGTPQVHSLGS